MTISRTSEKYILLNKNIYCLPTNYKDAVTDTLVLMTVKDQGKVSVHPIKD